MARIVLCYVGWLKVVCQLQNNVSSLKIVLSISLFQSVCNFTSNGLAILKTVKSGNYYG
jgi:hypothetical protein